MLGLGGFGWFWVRLDLCVLGGLLFFCGGFGVGVILCLGWVLWWFLVLVFLDYLGFVLGFGWWVWVGLCVWIWVFGLVWVLVLVGFVLVGFVWLFEFGVCACFCFGLFVIWFVFGLFVFEFGCDWGGFVFGLCCVVGVGLFLDVSAFGFWRCGLLWNFLFVVCVVCGCFLWVGFVVLFV